MRIALFQPEIAGNVGTILRMAACFDLAVDLIEPLGFPWDDRALRRAAMDYGPAARVTRHADWAAFAASLAGRLVLATTQAAQRLETMRFQRDDVILFGSESAGVPLDVHQRADACFRIAMRSGFRSLNVAVAAGIAVGEALRQTGGWPE